ncbi:hypothetical protein BGW36DRAFT_84579 [Talaromyces proteolyticus]|uniref:Uncharacterized protein n=1 Tax=Talaromyces proteolyticus TaxID=1131652 RepID=A0AAD4PZQ7_9EURO|nr:uncharacterized protein BGW36DRAFT_84579 [Talaromyces proteolyticus]KAH8703263.1 hypothetical protein BGW36DRAFT_84579 [Talaromyces proteolyticus]
MNDRNGTEPRDVFFNIFIYYGLLHLVAVNPDNAATRAKTDPAPCPFWLRALCGSLKNELKYFVISDLLLLYSLAIIGRTAAHLMFFF